MSTIDGFSSQVLVLRLVLFIFACFGFL